MVCVKQLVVDVDGVLANNGEVLREIKKKYPNIAQLFHFRKSHHVHFVGPATTQIDIVNASNDVYHAAGEPFALTAEHATIFVSLVMTHTSDAIEKLLEGIFRETEKFARDDKLRPGWRVSGPLYGVCASTPERRRELMELCIAKINKAYDVKLVLMAEPFRVHIGVPMFSDAASAATQSAWGGDTWSAASYHAPAYPNTMVAHQGLVLQQQSRLQPHLGCGIIVAAPSNSHLAAFGFAQETVSEQAEKAEMFKAISITLNELTAPFNQLAAGAAAAPLVVPSSNSTRSTAYDPALTLERRFFVTGVDSTTVVAAVSELQMLINAQGLLVIHLASLSEAASAVTISAAVDLKATTVDPTAVAQLIALGEDFMLSRCGAGPYMLELPATGLLKRFFKKGSKGHSEQLSRACQCLRRNESLEITGDLNDGIATVSVIVRGMRGRELRERAEKVIIPAVKECLECEAIEDICVPLPLFDQLADQNGLCVISKNVDINADVEDAFLLGSKNARNQLTIDVNTFANLQCGANVCELPASVSSREKDVPSATSYRAPDASPKPVSAFINVVHQLPSSEFQSNVRVPLSRAMTNPVVNRLVWRASSTVDHTVYRAPPRFTNAPDPLWKQSSVRGYPQEPTPMPLARTLPPQQVEAPLRVRQNNPYATPHASGVSGSTWMNP